MNTKDIPRKANRVLYLITVSLLLIFVRVWYLQTIGKPEHVKRARAPRERTLHLKPMRGAIFDRFGLPLAINKVQYNACVYFNPIREIPSVRWLDGKKMHVRRQYIASLCDKLAKELDLSVQDIEDLIYSRAAIFPNTPYAIKTDIDERTYARLKMLEKDFPGLVAECSQVRAYPQGKVGSDVIGYLGAINQYQSRTLSEKLKELESFVKAREAGLPVFLPKGFKTAQSVRQAYAVLKKQAYSINTLVGRAGIERQYDQELRGVFGKQGVELDVKGQLVRKLPGKEPPIAGNTMTLSLSAELQAYAEELLALSEKVRDDNFSTAGKNHTTIRGPWIKGGAIVALDPSSGEVLTCANYPRFDPNDFIKKSNKISQWLETPNYIAKLWDGNESLEKEVFKKSYLLQTEPLTWPTYLDMVLAKHSRVKQALLSIKNLSISFQIQEWVDYLLHFSGQDHVSTLINALYPKSPLAKGESLEPLVIEKLKSHPSTTQIQARLNTYLKNLEHNDDKLLFLDLLRLNANRDSFSPPLIELVGSFTLENHRATNQAASRLLSQLEKAAKKLFHENEFANWRRENFTAYLKEKRAVEKAQHSHARPYLDYLLKEESKQFKAFWHTHRYTLLSAILHKSPDALSSQLIPYYRKLKVSLDTDIELLKNRLDLIGKESGFTYLKTLLPFEDLSAPLWGKYRNVKSKHGQSTLKDLAAAFYPPTSFGYGTSHAYRRSSPPGSVFKIVTAYAALKQMCEENKTHNLNPMTLFDETSASSILGRFANGAPIPRRYKGGQIPRSHGRIGKVDLLTAIERSSNVYFSILAGDYLKSPSDLLNAAIDLGYGKKTGIDLPGEYAGILPTDLIDNKTGLYSFAIGQHTFDGTPLQTAVMLSTIANGGDVLKPHLYKKLSGSQLTTDKNPLQANDHYPYQAPLKSVGVHFPLFTKTLKQNSKSTDENPQTMLINKIFMPDKLCQTLIEGMHRVVNGDMGSARSSRIKALYQQLGWKETYNKIQPSLCGKTSTPEFFYKPTLEKETPPLKCKHAWFGGISFTEDKKPELVVVVYLRFADYGKEAAPIAALIVKKWRELCQKHQIQATAENIRSSDANHL